MRPRPKPEPAVAPKPKRGERATPCPHRVPPSAHCKTCDR